MAGSRYRVHFAPRRSRPRLGGTSGSWTVAAGDAPDAASLTSVIPMSETGVMGAAAGTGPDGLTAAEVAQRVDAGQVNVADDRTSRTFAEIVRANVLTRFNAILSTAFALILIFGEGQDALFGFVLVFNILIGTNPNSASWPSPKTRMSTNAVTRIALNRVR